MHGSRIAGFLAVILIFGGACFGDTLPQIPQARDVRRYERVKPVFKIKEIARGQGEALIAAMDGGRALEMWGHTSTASTQPDMLREPAPPYLQFNFVQDNGKPYYVAFSYDGGLVYLPGGLYGLNADAHKKISEILAQLTEDLKKEILSAPRPCKYSVCTADDGGTLTGIARMFYGDGGKWKQIYEANRRIIKDPNVIRTGMKLTIPDLTPKQK